MPAARLVGDPSPTPARPSARSLDVPLGPLPRLFYGLCRRGPAPQPARCVDGWDCYEFTGLDGGRFQLALRGESHPERSEADERAVAGLNHAAGDDGALVELVVLFARLLELAGRVGLWHFQRVTEIVHGAHARPERHNKPIAQFLALLERARFCRDPKAPPSSWSQLVVLERRHRTSATVQLDPRFERELAAVTYPVPVDTFLVGRPVEPVDRQDPTKGVRDVTNPQGNLPSRRARARFRVSYVLEVAPTRPGERPKASLDTDVERLVVAGGGDVERVKKRRHVVPFWGAALDELAAVGRALGVLLVEVREQVGSVLKAVVRFVRPARDQRPPTDAPPAATASRGPP